MRLTARFAAEIDNTLACLKGETPELTIHDILPLLGLVIFESATSILQLHCQTPASMLGETLQFTLTLGGPATADEGPKGVLTPLRSIWVEGW